MRVLFVSDHEEDYPAVLESLSRLAAPGFTLRRVADQDAALGSLPGGEADVCLLDHRMGARNGLELLERMQKSVCRVPVVLLTTSEDMELCVEAMRVGAAGCLSRERLGRDLLSRYMQTASERKLEKDELLKAGTVIQTSSERCPIFRNIPEDWTGPVRPLFSNPDASIISHGY